MFSVEVLVSVENYLLAMSCYKSSRRRRRSSSGQLSKTLSLLVTCKSSCSAQLGTTLPSAQVGAPHAKCTMLKCVNESIQFGTHQTSCVAEGSKVRILCKSWSGLGHCAWEAVLFLRCCIFFIPIEAFCSICTQSTLPYIN